jgi:hypothetical protein
MNFGARQSTELTDETVEEFLKRGGTIQRCPTRRAGMVPYSVIPTQEGWQPLTSTGSEHIPQWATSVERYDDAQREGHSDEDDGTAAAFREYEHDSIPRDWIPNSLSPNDEE